MVNYTLWLLGLLPFTLAANFQGGSTNTVPGSYLVEFPMDDSSSTADLDAYKHQFSQEMADRQIPFRFVNNYTSVFHGCNIAVRGEYTSLMSKLESVKVIAIDATMSSDAYTKISRRSLVEHPPLPQLAHYSTNYDKLMAKNNVTGKGVKIGIIDSGIDYNHPAFGSCYKTPGCRIQYGYDFVGDNYNGKNTPEPDDDPLDTCNSHGTHVAGIAAGNDGVFKSTAPEATLGIYRVLGCQGSTSTSVVMAALQKAYDDGMDVINVSISFPSGFTADIASFRTEAFAKQGVIVVASVGNDGIYSMWMAGSPTVGSGALAVGSSEPEYFWAQAVNITTSAGVHIYSRSAPQDHLHHFNFDKTPVMVAEDGGTDLSAKPDLIAPGSNIYSALPLNMGLYGIISGTSMSSPYVAGIVTLMREKFPQGNVTEFKWLLTHVANLLKETVTSSSGKSEQDMGSIVQQGGGTVNLENIMDDFRLTIENSISIGDDTHASPENPNWRKFTATLKNNTPKNYKFTFIHSVGLAITSYLDKETYVSNINFENYSIPFRYQPIKGRTLLPYTTFTITGFMILDNVPVDRFYVVSGYYFFRIYDGDRLIPRQAPWMGLRWRFRGIPMLPRPDHHLAPSLISDDKELVTDSPHIYDTGKGKFPKFRFSLMFNCELILIQVAQRTSDDAVQYHDIEYMYGTYLQRNYKMLRHPFYFFNWTATFKVNNTVNTYEPAPAGNYWFYLRLLKPTAKENETGAFTIWESPEFQLVPAA
ncbi:hypothetical protein IWQ61_002870 [Dispira simplex]|nr:hypothetical protein IWQ61_002870 [Dispira simplex]